MRYLRWAAPLALALVLAPVTSASARPAAAVPPPPCPAGYRLLIDWSGAGYQIQGHGSGVYVTTTEAGNCWKNAASSNPNYPILLENGSGKCLNVVASTFLVDEATSCNPNSSQQQWLQYANAGATTFVSNYGANLGAEHDSDTSQVTGDWLGQTCYQQNCLWVG